MIQAADGEQPSRKRSLEAVLQEALVSPDPASALDPDVSRALEAVACRHPGVDLELDPVVVDLTSAVIAAYFRGSESDEWKRMARTIAETLWENESSRRQLERLWMRLKAR